MPSKRGDGGDRSTDERRRRFIGYAAFALLAGGGGAGAWYATRPSPAVEPQPTTDIPPTTATSTSVDEPTDEIPALVRRYAPDLYFGALEKWYPTDPRAYLTTGDDRIVDGFTALEGYSARFAETGVPPDPAVFYNVVEAADGVDAIQYWMYSVFDQFTVNFHWHDWELLQVFVDRDTGEPLLLSASAHARSVPNNEYLGPDLSDDRRPGILTEVGSHSSASELNGVAPSFERVTTQSWHSDVTNDLVDTSATVTAPFAYGLPRNEGARLPFVMPELDGHRLDQHPSLSVSRDDFVDERVTVSAWRELLQPPSNLPLREPGLVLAHADSPTNADARYTLEPIEPLRDAIDDFVGPQLSFEFVIPGFVEDRFADHITSTDIPWDQPRFSHPFDDVTDPVHRQRIDGTTPSSLLNRVVGQVRRLGTGVEGTLRRVPDDVRSALEPLVAVSLFDLPVEVAVRLASESPVATVTRQGVFGYLHVETGAHLLVVNGPGLAPVAERFVHEGGRVRAGAEGDLTVVATEDAAWIRGDGRETTGIAHVRVTEDFAGVVYDAQPIETDRFAVAVHRDGHYTVDVIDANGRAGAYRVGPASFGDGSDVVLERVETGKAVLSGVLRDELGTLSDVARALGEQAEGGRAVIERLARAEEEAGAAASAAERGDTSTANEWLSSVVSTLTDTLKLLVGDDQSGYDDAAVTTIEPRVRRGIDRADAAIEADSATGSANG